MPKSKNTRLRGAKTAALPTTFQLKPAKQGFDPSDLKKAGKAQRGSGGKPPRFPGRAGGR